MRPGDRNGNVRREALDDSVIPTGVLRKAMHEIAAKKGDFTLFALFKRADGLGRWDLVVSAPWLEGSTRPSFFAPSSQSGKGRSVGPCIRPVLGRRAAAAEEAAGSAIRANLKMYMGPHV
jgi:hypothetical protein